MRWLLIVAILFAAACGAAPQSTSGGSTGVRSDGGGPVAAEMDSGFLTGKARKQDTRPEPSGTPQTGIDQKLVKNARLTIQVKNDDKFEPAVANAVRIARGLDGYVARQSRSSITFKVPSGRLDEALAALAELGKVKHRDVTAVDVTANYLDLSIRIENLGKLRVRLQELVAQGQNVKEILEVEKELARVTMQLEALEGQMRLLSNQTAFATVSVTFQERVRPGPIGWVFYGLYHGVKWLFVWD